MPNYLIDSMTWSYSRLNAYLQCPYQFYLKYIESLPSDAPGFFSQFGTFVHELLADYYAGRVSKEDSVSNYLTGFPSQVTSKAPNDQLRARYFRQGLAHMEALDPFPGQILEVEKRHRFTVGGLPFVGIIDLLCEDGNGALMIVDHKSGDIKPRSTGKRKLKSDADLDERLRQLYLYAQPVLQEYGRPPDFLCFNCYRTNVFIKEKFHKQEFEAALNWAAQTIEAIRDETEWLPNVDFWYCRHLCDFRSRCEYAELM